MTTLTYKQLLYLRKSKDQIKKMKFGIYKIVCQRSRSLHWHYVCEVIEYRYTTARVESLATQTWFRQSPQLRRHGQDYARGVNLTASRRGGIWPLGGEGWGWPSEGVKDDRRVERREFDIQPERWKMTAVWVGWQPAGAEDDCWMGRGECELIVTSFNS